MFFSISKTPKINFSNVKQYGSIYVNLDEGWQSAVIGCVDIIYKGYLDDGHLYQKLAAIVNEETPTYKGNFCIIQIGNSIKIKSDVCRSFPIYYNEDEITNLTQLKNIAGANVLITADTDLSVTTKTFNIIGNISTDTINIVQAVEIIDSILSKKIETFVKSNTLPLKVFLTGGLDSMLLYSYIKRYTDNFELMNYLHFEFDHFWLQNKHTIQNNWAYNQIHHWTTAAVLVSGTPGDEFMLRSPSTANAFLSYFKTEIPELLRDPVFNNCIHFDYFSKQSNQKLFLQQYMDGLIFKNRQMLTMYLCNITVNDFQHWHLGNTLTYTPLRDLEIFKTILQLDLDSAKQQIMNGDITRALIARNDASLLPHISPQKNSKDSLSFLTELIL